MRIVFFGSCWPTNIGNAFVNLGAIASLRQAIGDRGEVEQVGGMSSYLAMRRGVTEHSLPFGRWLDADYVVMGGMTQCVAHLRSVEPNLRHFLGRGARLVIAGGSGEFYRDEEVADVRRFMERYPVYAFVSRDTHAYERYGDLATHSYDGIDSAFFVPDAVTPVRLCNEEYVVVNFDTLAEPEVRNAPNPSPRRKVGPPPGWRPRLRAAARRVLRRTRSAAGSEAEPIDAEGRLVVRTHHAVMPDAGRAFEVPYTLASDLPTDYLSLYAYAHATYSDRIHACIATLALGGRARLYGGHVPRLRMFERVGAGEILERPVVLDAACIADERKRQVEFLRDVL